MRKLRQERGIEADPRSGAILTLIGPPGTGKTSLVEAAFGGEVITVAGDGDTTTGDLVGDYTQRDDGSYEFVPTGDGGTEVKYHLEVELRVPIPGFIYMRAQSRIMATALRELRARVESSA